MSIRNDKWIIQQSTRPGFIVTADQFVSDKPHSASSLRVREHTYLSHLDEAQLTELVNQRKQRLEISGLSDGVKEFHPVTDENIVGWHPMIEPFEAKQVRVRERLLPRGFTMPVSGLNQIHRGDEIYYDERVISYGTSSFGYDVRIADEFMIFHNALNAMVDPKNFDEKSFLHFKGDVCIIPPNSFVLARSYEYFRMPKNVSGLVLGKSTYARCGINCLATPLEPGWEGHITLEYANTTPLPAKLYANEGAAQVQFFEGELPAVTYADRGGKYQGQRGITLPKA